MREREITKHYFKEGKCLAAMEIFFLCMRIFHLLMNEFPKG
jgi:hypothetical protein